MARVYNRRRGRSRRGGALRGRAAAMRRRRAASRNGLTGRRPELWVEAPGMAASPDEPARQPVHRGPPRALVRRGRHADPGARSSAGATAPATGCRTSASCRPCSTSAARRCARRCARSRSSAILDIRPGKRGGIFVAAPSGSGVGSALEALILLRGATTAELNEFRTSFEGETAAWAAERADARGRASACSSTPRGCAPPPHATDTRWEEMVDLDVHFHELVAQASKNQVRVAVMLGLLRAVQHVELRVTPLADPGLHRDVAAELTAVAEAISRARARPGARGHARPPRPLLRALLRRLGAHRARSADS